MSDPTPEQVQAAAAAEARLQKMLALGDVSQANAATGIYGDSGVGKSTLCATAAEYCWNRYHKVTRYVAADLGGFGNKLLRLMRLGIVQAYSPANHVEPFETMEDLSMGYWPEEILDPFTGYAHPEVKLLAPQSTKITVFCSQGHPVKSVSTKAGLNGFSLQCPTCKGTPVTPQTWGKVEELTVRAPMVQHVGLYIFDSGTALEDWAMEDMAARAAKNDPNIKDGNALSGTGARILSGKHAFGANTMQHYGFAQNRMRAWIKNARHIPGQVVPPIFTFLENRGTDDTKGVAVFGPKIAGNAKTVDVPSWLGNCLHTTKENNNKGVAVHRVWLVNHIDAGMSIPHLAKTRAEPGTLPPFLEDGPEDAPFTKFSLGYFFDQLEGALTSGARQDSVDFPDAPLFVPLANAGEENVVSRRDLGTSEMALRLPSVRQMPTAGPAVAARTVAPPVGRPAAPVGATAAPARPAFAPIAGGKPATNPAPVAPTLLPLQPKQPPVATAPITPMTPAAALQRPPRPAAVAPPPPGVRKP